MNNFDVDYQSRDYLTLQRWITYAKLVQKVLENEPKKILEIGPGNFMLSDILKKFGFTVHTLDKSDDLNPDYAIDIRNINKQQLNEGYDIIIASQVFEHVEYREFLKVMKFLSTQTRKMIITLPSTDSGSRFFSFNITIPSFRGTVNFKKCVKFYLKRVKNFKHDEHNWEIGIQQYPLRKVKKDIKNCGWSIKESFFNPENPYHFFFILKSTEKTS